MRSARLSPRTIVTYTSGVESFLKFCERTGALLQLTKVAAQSRVVDLLDGGSQPATATTWLGALKRYAARLEEEGEIPANPLIGMRTPRVDRKVTNAMTDDQIKALLNTCKGKIFRNRRDEAIIRLLAETGMRASELVDLQVGHVDLARGLGTVHAARAARAGLRRSGRRPRRPSTAMGACVTNTRRAAMPNFSSVRTSRASLIGPWLRPCAAVWNRLPCPLIAPRRRYALASGRWVGEGSLMAVAGWSNRQMIDRYTGASAPERAAEEARELNLGNL